jgi:ATP-binding protein involved in chromosome partitioning
VADAATSVDGVDAAEVAFRSAAPPATGHVEMLPDVKHVVAVASGKGGVGKSTVATNLAVALADAGAAVGLVDADVYGPNAPAMLGIDDATPETTADDRMVPRERHGVRAMSVDFVAADDDPVIWRGPLVDEFVKQLFGDVVWGELDYLVVDTPPGTGDVHLSLVQHLPVAGVVVVTTPEEVAVDDATRGLVGFARYDVPVLGVVENMASFTCPDCGSTHDPFGRGGGTDLAEGFEVPVLGSLPLDPAVGTDETEEPTTPPGIDLPVVGRLQLPRTREERRAGGGRPLVARDDGGETGERLRAVATRVAARVNQAAVDLDE